MFDDYQSAVLRNYQQKKTAGSLSPNLEHPTPAKLKAECLTVVDERLLKSDERVLRLYIGLREDATAYRQALKLCEADKFKPLCNYLKKRSGGTDEKNIELLAWLIDFEPRPYKSGQSYDDNAVSADLINPAVESKTILPETNEGQERDKEINRQPATEALTRKHRYVLILLLGLVLTGGGAYLLLKKTDTPFAVTGREKCMYWATDHYQPVSCEQKVDGAIVIALDPLKVAGFKLITNPDTITKKALGHVWYIKLNGKIEYYTGNGFHPVHIERQLKPLSQYMLNKYIAHR